MATTTITIRWPYGVNTMRAGTPVDEHGIYANDANAIGVVTKTVVAPNKALTVLTSGEWDPAVSAANGVPLVEEAMRAMSAITFVGVELPPLPPVLPVPEAGDIGDYLGIVEDGSGAKYGVEGVRQLPDPTELDDGTIMVVQDGEWVPAGEAEDWTFTVDGTDVTKTIIVLEQPETT